MHMCEWFVRSPVYMSVVFFFCFFSVTVSRGVFTRGRRNCKSDSIATSMLGQFTTWVQKKKKEPCLLVVFQSVL